MVQFHNFSETAQRFFGATLLLPLIAGFWFSPILAHVMFLIISVLMSREFGEMTGLNRLPMVLLQVLTGLANLWPFIAAIYNWTEQIMFVFAIGLALIGKIGLSLLTTTRQISNFGFLMIMCVASGSAMLALPEGRFLILALALVIASCDSAAYFVGRVVGGPRLAPAISPNKTISGALGGMLATLLVSALLFGPETVIDLQFYILGEKVMLSWVQVISGGLVIGFSSQLGDLLESALKRRLGLKDSSQLIPGHGGVLDRFDGYLLTLPTMFLFFMLI